MEMAPCELGAFTEAVPYLKDATAGDARNLPLRLVLAHSCLWAKQYQCVLNVDHEIRILNAEFTGSNRQARPAEHGASPRPERISGHLLAWNFTSSSTAFIGT